MTPANEEAFYERSMRRILWLIAILGCLGSAYLAIARGWRWGVGFLAGAAVSWASFWRWKKVADALGSAPKNPSALRWMIRFLVLAGAAYVIVKYLGVNLVAALLGLLVAAAAVVFEIIYQLFHSGA